MKAEDVALTLQQPPLNGSKNDSVISDHRRSAASSLVNIIYGEDAVAMWYQTANRSKQVDVSDEFFARKKLEDIKNKPCPSLGPPHAVIISSHNTIYGA